MREIKKILEKGYKRYCHGDRHCYSMTCPLNAIIWNMGIHLIQGDKLLIYGNYKLLEKMGT